MAENGRNQKDDGVGCGSSRGSKMRTSGNRRQNIGREEEGTNESCDSTLIARS